MLPDGNFDGLVTGLVEEQENTQTFGLSSIINPPKRYGSPYLGGFLLGTSLLNSIGLIDQIVGKIDGLVALKQSIYLMLSVEADQYIIYPYTYGVNTLDLIGRPAHYIIAVLPERIQETLLRDDRILGVSDFDFTVKGNKIHTTFTVHTIYGDIDEETEVSY